MYVIFQVSEQHRSSEQRADRRGDGGVQREVGRRGRQPDIRALYCGNILILVAEKFRLVCEVINENLRDIHFLCSKFFKKTWNMSDSPV